VLPLHSPRPHTSLHTIFSEFSRDLPVIVVDYSGRNVSVFPLGSSRSAASHPDILCQNELGAEGPFFRGGCGNATAFSAISAYSGLLLKLRTDNKIVIKPKAKFYFSFAMVVEATASDGSAPYGNTTFQFCSEFTFDPVAALLPPDWAVVLNSSVIRSKPASQLRCLYFQQCFVDVCAAHFTLDSNQNAQVSGRSTFIDVVSSSSDERFVELQMQPLAAPSGVVCGRVYFGYRSGYFSQEDTSKVHTVCLRARSQNVMSPSNQLCVSAKVCGRP
jgi:hypothetical protein